VSLAEQGYLKNEKLSGDSHGRSGDSHGRTHTIRTSQLFSCRREGRNHREGLR